MHAIRHTAFGATALILVVGAALPATPLLLPSPAWAGARKVQVCHVPPGRPANRHTISVTPLAAKVHLVTHAGDRLGECPPPCDAGPKCDPKKVKVCHVPPGHPANRHTISVAPSAAEAHLAHHAGDHLGECPPRCDDGTDCDDADPCSIDGCENGFCDFSEAVECDDGNTCTIDLCLSDEGGCVGVPTDGSCDDGVVCTTGDQCQPDGSCRGDKVLHCCRRDADCDDRRACTEDICHEATGKCANPDVVCPAAPACHVSICDPQSGCTTEPIVCADDGNVCTVESCDPTSGATGACVTTANPNPPEPTEVSCGDKIDNDCDGLPEKIDPDCQCQVPCALTYTAALQGCQEARASCCPSGCTMDEVGDCDAEHQRCYSTAVLAYHDCGQVCPCDPQEQTEVSCTDGLDNDCDGLPDNDDPDCRQACLDQCAITYTVALRVCQKVRANCCASGCTADEVEECDVQDQTCHAAASQAQLHCAQACP